MNEACHCSDIFHDWLPTFWNDNPLDAVFFSGPLGGEISPPNSNKFRLFFGYFSHFSLPTKAIILALVLASHHVWMHGDKCPSAVSSPPETAWKSDPRKPVRILLSSYLVLSHSKQWRSRICGHRAQNLLVLRSPQLPFTFGPNVHASLTGDPIPRKSDPGWIRYAS